MAGRPLDRGGKRMAKEMAKEGYSNAEIAVVLKVGKTTVWRWVTNEGKKLRGREHLRRVDRAEIKRLRRRGFTYREIGEVVGCTAVTARKLFHGLPAGGGR